MQEEVENRTVNLAISTTKLTGRTICGSSSDAQDLSNIVNRIRPSFRGFFLRAVPCLRHENPLSVMKRNSTNMCW